MLLARVCGACGSWDGPLCAACADRLQPAQPVPALAGAAGVSAVLRFDGAGRDLVLGLKYRNRRGAVAPLAKAMAEAVGSRPLDVVTWAPTSAARRRARGFDQARLLAGVVARCLDLPCRRLLRRRPGPAQTGLDATQRHDLALGPSFIAVRPVSGSILLVDDVVTTGATLEAATAVLRTAGASSVEVVVAAATPLKGTSR